MTKAETILAQLGGLNRIGPMLGVRFHIAKVDGVAIRFAAKARKGINHLEIILDESSDTYRVEFYWIHKRGTDFECVERFEDIHASELKALIESRTGLALSL